MKATRCSILILSCLLIASGSYSQISNVGGETYTTEVTVQLRTQAFNDNTGASQFTVAEMSDLVSNTRAFLEKLGAVELRKIFTGSFWGDTLHHSGDGSTFVVPDLSQIYRIRFAQPVKMWETVYNLRKLPDVSMRILQPS